MWVAAATAGVLARAERCVAPPPRTHNPHPARTQTIPPRHAAGKAAHWAYKEKPMTAAPTAPTAPSGAPSTPGPALAAAAAASAAGAGGAPGSTASSDDDSGYWLGIDVGHPMLHISPGGCR